MPVHLGHPDITAWWTCCISISSSIDVRICSFLSGLTGVYLTRACNMTAVETSATASLCQNMWVRAVHMLWLSSCRPGIATHTDVYLYFQEQATCLWHTAQVEPRHPRHGTGLHHAATPNLCRQRWVSPDAPDTDVPCSTTCTFQGTRLWDFCPSWVLSPLQVAEDEHSPEECTTARALIRWLYGKEGLLMYSPL